MIFLVGGVWELFVNMGGAGANCPSRHVSDQYSAEFSLVHSLNNYCSGRRKIVRFGSSWVGIIGHRIFGFGDHFRRLVVVRAFTCCILLVGQV